MSPAERPQSADRAFVSIHGPLAQHEATRICERVRALLGCDAARGVVCRIEGAVDLSTVDLLARLQLITQRHHASLEVRAGEKDLGALVALLAFTGLEEVLFERRPPAGKRP